MIQLAGVVWHKENSYYMKFDFRVNCPFKVSKVTVLSMKKVKTFSLAYRLSEEGKK